MEICDITRLVGLAILSVILLSSVESEARRGSRSRACLTEGSYKFKTRLGSGQNASREYERISGGRNAKPGEFPSFVSLRLRPSYKPDDIYYCSGVLINPKWVLTAAHCIDNPKLVSVEVGIGTRGPKYWTPGNPKVHSAAKACASTLFSMAELPPRHDFGLVKLKEKVKLSGDVQIVNLPDAPIGDDEQAFSVGIGGTTTILYQPIVAQVLPVKKGQCTPNWTHPSRICFQSNQDSYQGKICKGDSGGPVYVNRAGKIYTVGVASYGPADCSKTGGISVWADVYRQKKHIRDMIKLCEKQGRKIPN